MLAVLLLLQAAGPVLPTRYGCPPPRPGAAADAEVVVCARPTGEDPYRLQPLPPAPGVRAEAPDPLGFALPGGGRGRVHAIQSNLPGASGQGAAVTLALPIGKRPKPASR